ncbi:hypothetical protein QL285_083541 [Trifolium repens]|nr:hypothetical protein QL285_083541 [Trifolium repens]
MKRDKQLNCKNSLTTNDELKQYSGNRIRFKDTQIKLKQGEDKSSSPMIQAQLQSPTPTWSLLQLTCLPKKIVWSGVRLLSLSESYYPPRGYYTGGFLNQS